MAARPTAGIKGGPVAASPRMAHPAYTHNDQSGGGGLLSTLLVRGFDCGSDAPFALCDGPQDEVDFDRNPTGVFVAVHTKQWNLVVERTKVYPTEASTWVVRFGSHTEGLADDKAFAPDTYSCSSDRIDAVAVTSPRAGPQAELKREHKVLRWRMLPIHLAVLFCSPPDVIKTLLKAYPVGCSAQDDQGMLPLHLAFRSGCSEEIVLLLLGAYPEAIEQVDHKGRLPSMLAPKKSMSYVESIGEAFVKGPAYYYWASRVATADRLRSEMAMTADRVRSETAMTKQIKQLEENVRVSNERGLSIQKGLSIENAELKEQVAWYESKYDGAEEKEKVLVDHTNSLAERLRLTSLSEEHLATKLAKIESRLHNKETELKQARTMAAEEKEVSEYHVKEMEQILVKTKHKEKSLTLKLDKKITESNEMKALFEKESQLFEKQVDASKECLMELITSSKQDKRRFEQETKELRRQLTAVQAEAQNEKQMFEKESEELQQELATIKIEEKRAAEAQKSSNTIAVSTAAVPQSLEEKLDSLRKEVIDNTRSFMSHANATAEKHISQFSSSKKIDDRLDSLKKEVTNDTASQGVQPQQVAEQVLQQHSYSSRNTRIDQPIEHSVHAPKSSMPRSRPSTHVPEKEEPFDTYVSTKSSSKSCADDTRDDTECFSHLTDVDTAMALGELSEEQRLALEQLDLSGSKEEIAAMLNRVPGLTNNQVNLLVDVASSLTL